MAGAVRWPQGTPKAWGRLRGARSWRPMEHISPRVNVTLRVWDASTPALEAAARAGSGRLLALEAGHNRVPTGGRNLLRDLLNGDALSGITEFAIGDDNTATSNNDTELGNELLRATLTSTSKDTLKLTAQYFLASTLLNGETLREAGLYTDEDTLFARYVLDTEIEKDNTIAVTFTWEITFTVTELNILERGSVVELGGDANTYVVGNAYPVGATLDKIVNGSATWLIDSADLQGGTFALEGHVKVTAGGITPTIALFNLSDGAPNVALAGSEVAGSAGNTTGERIRSGAITFPAAGAAKQLAVKVKTDNAAGESIVWGLRIVRLT